MPSAKQIANLRRRWDPPGDLIDLSASPYGLTADGFADFHGLPVKAYRQVVGRSISRCDFSHADFSEIDLTGLAFLDCIFDRANFSRSRDRNCLFQACSFDRTNFQDAALLLDESLYKSCSFIDCKLKNVSFYNGAFSKCRFQFRKLRKVQFGACGFWDCVFVGRFEDLWFKGNQEHSEFERSYLGEAKLAGLHNVDFSEASLSMLAISNRCALDNLQMPRDGSALVCSIKQLKDLTIAENLYEAKSQSGGVKMFLDVFSYSSQDDRIIALEDVIDLCGDDIGQKVYECARAIAKYK